LVVILAGYGQLETLAVFAADDPDADVRATACLHLARTSSPQLAWVQELLEARLRIDGAVPVQVVLFDLVLSGNIRIDQEQVMLGMRHPDGRIRDRAADHVIATWVRDDQVPREVVEALAHSDLDIRARFRETALDRLGSDGFLRLLGGLEQMPTDILEWQLEEVVRTGGEVRWSSIAQLADRPGLEDELSAIVAPGDVASRPWLLRIVARYSGYGWWQAREKLMAVLENDPPLSPEERAFATEIREAIDQQLAEPPVWKDWMDAEDIEEHEEWLESLRNDRDALDRAIEA
jgi:hypothetical protein